MKEIKIGDYVISQNTFTMIAGPCSIESLEQFVTIVKELKDIKFIRGGAFKPRTNPNSFQGLGKEAIEIALGTKKKYNKFFVSEILDSDDIEHFKDVDIIQIGARNMQNFSLLKKVARLNKPILLKRGMGNTIDELINSAKYIEQEGNEQIIFCERGIRTFEIKTRFTLDIAAIDIIKRETPYPIIIDPSHAAGCSSLVESLALAATAAGCNGLIVEVHNDPKNALSDAEQQLTIEEFNKLYSKVERWKK